MRAIVRSPNADVASAFTLGPWVTGNPIVADAAPNSTPPAASRIVRVLAADRGATAVAGAGAIRVLAIGGTSLLYQPWFYDDGLATWVKYGPVFTITLATNNISTVAPFNMNNAQFFIQATTVNGTVTAFGYGLA